MPRKQHPHPQSTPARLERARQYLRAGGISREDSDDELGLEDHPWQWIYSTPSAPEIHKGRSISGSQDIVGARMGAFECRLGDCVLLKAEGTKEAWVGLVCEFLQQSEDEGSDDEDTDSGYDEGQGRGMAANFMWFSTAREIRNEKKRRGDALPNEVYITPSWDINPLASINGKATILSQRAFQEKHPSGKVPKSSGDSGKVFVCRRGCNTRTATYTEEFVWEDVFHGEKDLSSLIARIQSQTKATRTKRKRPDYDDDGDEVCEAT